MRSLAGTATVVHANPFVGCVDERVAQSRPLFFTFDLQGVAGRWLIVISQIAQAAPKD